MKIVLSYYDSRVHIVELLTILPNRRTGLECWWVWWQFHRLTSQTSYIHYLLHFLQFSLSILSCLSPFVLYFALNLFFQISLLHFFDVFLVLFSLVIFFHFLSYFLSWVLGGDITFFLHITVMKQLHFWLPQHWNLHSSFYALYATHRIRKRLHSSSRKGKCFYAVRKFSSCWTRSGVRCSGKQIFPLLRDMSDFICSFSTSHLVEFSNCEPIWKYFRV